MSGRISYPSSQCLADAEWIIRNLEERLLAETQKLKTERETVRMLRLCLQATVGEKCELHVHLHPEIFSAASFRGVQDLQRNFAAQTAHEIEHRVGVPGRELQEALMHINYLENHAQASGLQFKAWNWSAWDKGLINT